MKLEQLFPPDIIRQLPKEVDPDDANPTAYAKLFYPDFSWTWYVMAYNPTTGIAWGLVDGDFAECGDFYIPELLETRGKLGCEIERDLNFEPAKLKDLLENVKGQR